MSKSLTCSECFSSCIPKRFKRKKTVHAEVELDQISGVLSIDSQISEREISEAIKGITGVPVAGLGNKF